MATIEQFNAELKRVIPNIRFGAVVWMHSRDLRCNETSIQERRNQLSVFRQVIAWKDTDHVAIIANGHVMAIWHRDSKAEAQPATGTQQAAFGINDKVVIRKDAELLGTYRQIMQHTGAVGEVVDFDRARVIVEFAGGAADDGISFLPEELELWKPAKTGSDADWSAIAAATLDGLKSEDELRQEIADLIIERDTAVEEQKVLRAELTAVFRIMERLRSQGALPIVLSIRMKGIRKLLEIEALAEAVGE